MSNDKPDLWEQSRRTMALNTHTRKLACENLKIYSILVRFWDRASCHGVGERLFRILQCC